MTQNEQILNYLQSGKSITPLDALWRFGCFRLAARIYDLRDMGYDIACTIVTVNEDTRVASYSLKESKK